MDFERFAKSFGIPIGLILMKLLITLRTGIDTYDVSSDLLDVLVIDGAYLALWLIAAYSGKGQSAMALRPFAAGGAWMLYLAMLYIAWEAGHLQGSEGAVVVSLIARVAGAILLLYDTYDYVAALVQQRQKDHAASWKDSLRGSVNAVSYLIGALAAFPFVVILNLFRVGRDYADDNKTTVVRGRAVVHAPEQYTPPQIEQHYEHQLNDIDTPIVLEMQKWVNTHPKLNQSQMARDLNISRTTVNKYMPKIKLNGNGHKKTLLNARSTDK